MTGKLIAQFCVGFTGGDAISTESLNIQKTIRSWGRRCEVYAWPDYIDPDARGLCRPITEFDPSECELVIYHFSIGSPMIHHAARFPGKRVMIYHNVTPASYFQRYSAKIARELQEGRDQLASSMDLFDLALADSEFNRRELESLGYRGTAVLPFLFDPAMWNVEPAFPPFMKDCLTTLLFVGRLAPNKKAEDLIKIFGLYQRFYNPQSRLVWVGGWGGLELYYLELQQLIRDLHLTDVVLAGHLGRRELAACFRASDVFVSVSEHEGFCVPIVESFHHGKPVVAYGAGAVAETVGDAGLVFAEKDYGTFAEAVWRVTSDGGLRSGLAERGRRRLRNEFSFERTADLLRSYLF